ncbi:MAG: hypothetical protein IIU16_05955 [Bacteroidales bacterium]|nr:hypothetical protein [Bacteroidales bacterium]MBQ5402439.1 hypothetical protein [Bacteroidales bacterium]MBQ7458621.1 hypothetical protein [Bacteroidales bacterium]
MKRFISVLTAFLALGLGLAQAQVMPKYLDVEKGQFSNGNGVYYSDAEMLDIIGPEIFNETYVGAQKQYKAGGVLITTGAITLGVGALMAGAFLGVAAMDYQDSGEIAPRHALGYTSSLLLAAAGGSALTAGIPLRFIGRSRLNWIAEDYNDKQSNVQLHITGCPVGTGLGLALVF